MFTSVPLSAYREIAGQLKLKVVHAEPVKNEWIIKNRWKKGVKGDIPEFTNQLIVLEEP